MKKLVSLLLALIIAITCFGVSAFAYGYSNIVFSYDLSQIDYNGKSYYLSVDDKLMVECDSVLDNEVIFTDKTDRNIDEVFVSVNINESVLEVMIIYRNGSNDTNYYLSSLAQIEFNELKSTYQSAYTLEVGFEESEYIDASGSQLFGSAVTVGKRAILESGTYYVTVVGNDSGLRYIKGELLYTDGKYYYLDYEELGVEQLLEFDIYSLESAEVYEITDIELISKLNEAIDYESGAIGIIGDYQYCTVLVIFEVIVTLALAGSFVVFLVLSIGKKDKYGWIYATVCAFSGAAFISAAVTTVISAIVAFA